MYDLIILILSTFRISNLIVDEAGPYNIFGKFRNRLGIVEIEAIDEHDMVYKTNYVPNDTNELGKLFSCIWCLSPYIATLLILIPTKIRNIIVLPFTISAGAIIIKRFIDG